MKRYREVLNEIRLVHSDKSEKVTGGEYLGKKLTDVGGLTDRFAKTALTGDFTMYFDAKGDMAQAFVVNKSGSIESVIKGDFHNNVMNIYAADSTGAGPKMPQVYHELLRHKFVNAITSDSIQSLGGKNIWKGLQQEKGLTIHGWDNIKGEPINVDADDEEDIWVDGDEIRSAERDYRGAFNEPETSAALNTTLVATLKQRVFNQLHPRFPSKDIMHRGGQFKKKVG